MPKPRIRNSGKCSKSGRWCYEIPTQRDYLLLTSKLTFQSLIQHLDKLGVI